MLKLKGYKSVLKSVKFSTSSAAYIYPDGVSLLVREKTRSGAEAEVYHVWRGDTYMSCYSDVKVSRIVLHRPEAIIHGIARVEVYMGDGSDNMKRAGYKSTSVYIYDCDGGLFHDSSIPGLVSSYCTVQPNPFETFTFHAPNTIQDVIDHETVVFHD